MALVKVCGITNIEDAREAHALGYDAVGLVFAKSPRRLSPEQARSISRSLPAGILRVGVFVNEEAGEVKRLMEYCGLDLVQLHGEEDPGEVSEFGARAIKALRPRCQEDLGQGNETEIWSRRAFANAQVPHSDLRKVTARPGNRF